ncbi:MAG: class I SAM-dependent methyltransferase [Clostridia bacterium]|nr:class I SAM-dependent methyltransferase [Clostridia bacterium]
MDKDFLLKVYGSGYDSDAGPWNLSLQNKYLEYMFAKFFEENFIVEKNMCICNIGIGAGYWDRYLSYKLKGGYLTSIDINELACRQLKECLINEGNPNDIRVINSDVMMIDDLDESFDIVTMVGSSRLESGLYKTILEKVFSFVKKDGVVYYQSLDRKETKEDFEDLCNANKMKIEKYLADNTYGFTAQYWKVTKY